MREHWPLKIAALFLALVLWLVVSAREPTEEVIPVSFQPQLDSSLRLISQPPTVRALMIGRGREVLQLYSSPPLYRPVITAETEDTVTLTLTPSDIELPPEVDVLVRDVQPRSFMLRFAPSGQRFVPVRSGLTLAPDPSIRIEGPPRFDPESVLVTGPRRAVARVDSVTTVRETRVVCDGGAWIVSLDTSGLGARVRPAQVTARIPVSRDTAGVPGAVCIANRARGR